MLKIESLSLNIPNGSSEVSILKNINIDLEDNKFYALTGPNGGGKTSLARAIMGIYKVTAGKIYLDDVDITNYTITERAKAGISYAFQNPPRFKGLKVKDLLKISSGVEDDANYARLRAVGLCPQDYLPRECDNSLSGGEIKRIELATVLSRPSRIVIYDEPEAGVDLWSFEKLLSLIKKYHMRGGVTSIVITHHEKVLSLADEIILMAEGEIKERGARDEMWDALKGNFKCRWEQNCGGDEDAVECYR
ncbi:MAG: Fe-S cluster assembly ATP-binding protein [Tepidanaerobacteraceae bacterium]|nr:Fe-S cluster assembly ATP-binding protein [Tepidanaerobacteraceae bacterium]